MATTSTTSAKTKVPPNPLAGIPAEDWVPVPRSFVLAGRYVARDHALANARYRLLLLALWSRRFDSKPIRAYWEELGQELGVGSGAVRRWAYELREAGLLKIINHKGPVRPKENGQPGRRDERNTFDLTPLWKYLNDQVEPKRLDQRRKRSKPGGAS